ncbi:hypothetical protein CXB51_025971 [Gossypium anomalum]|uniref:Secreted protein n=1 Tax=Gossypium anomalum TaxID=47600 RepID=A0A8J6CS00_9ROSI|nr:hypothetical protein CXB51_025971 [Gossypium anomalum]
MLYKKSAVHLILVLLLSFSLLCPPSSTTNTHLTVKERNEENQFHVLHVIIVVIQRVVMLYALLTVDSLEGNCVTRATK